MAKMRGIKPETFTDDKVLQLSPLARWLFVGLWTVACDNGHVEDNLVQIKVRLLPVDDCSVGGLLDELLATQQVTREGGYLKVVNLAEHQNIDKRYLRLCEWCKTDPDVVFTEADRPARPSRAHRAEGSTDTVAHRATTVGTAGAQRGHTVEGEGEGEGEGDRGAQAAPGPRKRGHRIPDGFAITDDMRAWVEDKNLDHLDVDAITEEFIDYWRGVPGQKGVKLDWPGTWRNWIRRKADDVKVRPLRQPAGDPLEHVPSVEQLVAERGW